MISVKRNPSAKLCNAIAKALELPPELLLDKAGIINKTNEYTTMINKIAYKASLLSEQDQKIILSIIETILDERK